MWSFLKTQGWRYQKGAELVAFVYLPPEVEKWNSSMFVEGVDYASSEIGVVKLVLQKTSEASLAASSILPISGEAQAKSRYKHNELFANIVFLLTSLDDKSRETVTTQIVKHGGKVLPSIEAVSDIKKKAAVSKSSSSSPMVVVLSEANVNAHRRAKYQYALALGFPPLHYSWAIDSIKTKGCISLTAPYVLPIGVASSGRVELPLPLSNSTPSSSPSSIFEGLNPVILLSKSEVKEWKCVLNTAGATVVSCSHFNQPPEFLKSKGVNLLIAKSSDLLTGRQMRQSARVLGLRVASFDWVMQCLMQKEQLALDGHVSFVIGERNVSERIWVKRKKKKVFERAVVLTSSNSQYKVNFEDGATTICTEEQLLHPNEPRPKHVKAMFIGASHASEETLRRGGDLEYAAVSMSGKTFSVADTCITTDNRVGIIERLFSSDGNMRMRWRLLHQVNDTEVAETDEIIECNVTRLSTMKVILMSKADYEKANWRSMSETKQQKILFVQEAEDAEDEI